MTNDQKQLLKAIGIFMAFKLALYASINYAARVSRKAAQRVYDEAETN